MTDEEKKKQRANLLYECEEAQDNLSHLQEKARSMADALKNMSGWLDDLARRSKYEQMHTYRVSGKPFNIEDSRYREAVNFDAIMGIATEINEALRRLDILLERKNATRS